MQLGAFYDLNGDQNTGNYTFNISTKAPAVPEASTTLSFGAMLLLAAGGLVFTARKRNVTGQ